MYILNLWSALITVVGIFSFHTTDAQIKPGGIMTPKFINKILKLHNDYRRSEGASNMKQLASTVYKSFIQFFIDLKRSNVLCLSFNIEYKRSTTSKLISSKTENKLVFVGLIEQIQMNTCACGCRLLVDFFLNLPSSWTHWSNP